MSYVKLDRFVMALAERLERAVDGIDRRVAELMRQAERARSIA